MSRVAPCRVEFRQPRRTRVLGIRHYALPHIRSLDPFVSRLLQEGHHGVLVLVNEETGEVVAKRRVPAPGTVP